MLIPEIGAQRPNMNCHTRLVAVFFSLLIAASLSVVTPAAARGGGAANIMASPGYQRALEESRKRYRESYTSSRVEPSAPHKRKTSRRHRTHH
jgi:hypothetical protein